MDERSFERASGHTLSKLEESLADIDDRLDVDLAMGVLTLAFDDGAKFIVNSHRAARQIWMAAGAQAWHFDWDGEAWRAAKDGSELFALLETTVGTQLGAPVKLITD